MGLTKSELLYQKIKQDIFSLKYGVGDIINEQTIASEYNVSKTPVREALTALVQEGYLVKYPRRGYFIKEINFNEYYELTQYRFLLESGVIRSIISRRSDEEIRSLYAFTPPTKVTREDFKQENMKFHMAMASLTSNRYIISALETVFERNIRDSSMVGFNRIADDIHQDHRRIVDAMLARDVEGALRIITRELQHEDEKEMVF